jgi:hypothetical protein
VITSNWSWGFARQLRASDIERLQTARITVLLSLTAAALSWLLRNRTDANAMSWMLSRLLLQPGWAELSWSELLGTLLLWAAVVDKACCCCCCAHSARVHHTCIGRIKSANIKQRAWEAEFSSTRGTAIGITSR